MNAQVFKYLKSAWIIFVLASFSLIVVSVLKSNNEKVKETASSFFKEIVTARAWNAGHGGVYVFVTEDTKPNPDLDVPNRDILTQDGQMLTLINPAYMTRQISELAEKENDILYHITSLKPLRALNGADDWETEALESFEKGEKFSFERRSYKEIEYYRYMAPLKVKENCLNCHAKQGYQIGQIRGGISVSIKSKPYLSQIKKELAAISFFHIIFLIVGLFGISFSQKTISKQFKVTKLKSQQLALHKNKLTEINGQLTDLNNQKEKFLSIIAHDLKNPVGAIMGLSEVLVEEIEISDISHKKIMLNQLHNSAVNTYNLMENLLTWSRSQQGKMQYNPTELVLIDEIQEAFEIVLPLADAKLVECKINMGKNKKMKVWADKNMLSTILRNLFTNAIKFTPTNGSISIKAKIVDENLCAISVSDTGVGMPEEKINDLFKIEKSISTPGTNNEKGTGLGLILVKEFVDANKGSINISSQQNKGTNITFTIPTKRP